MPTDLTQTSALTRDGAPSMQTKAVAFLTGRSGMMTLSVLSMIGLWYFGTLLVPASVLPLPTDVLATMIDNTQGAQLWSDMGMTLRRICFAFVLAMSVASVLGFASALSQRADWFFRIWIILGMTIPALVLILMSYMIVGLNDTSAVIGAALPVIAILTINIREGVRALDTRIVGMALAFRAGRRQMLTQVIVPQVVPVLLASTRFGIGLIWKMVLFVELLGRGNGIGYRIEFYYQMFNMKQVLAQALSFLVVMLLIEVGVIGQAERRLYRWRRA